jgi:hypothetical protein
MTWAELVDRHWGDIDYLALSCVAAWWTHRMYTTHKVGRMLK